MTLVKIHVLTNAKLRRKLVLGVTDSAWCEHNRNRRYVPEWLLKEWSITVDPTFSDAA